MRVPAYPMPFASALLPTSDVCLVGFFRRRSSQWERQITQPRLGRERERLGTVWGIILTSMTQCLQFFLQITVCHQFVACNLFHRFQFTTSLWLKFILQITIYHQFVAEIYSTDYSLPPVCSWNLFCRLQFTTSLWLKFILQIKVYHQFVAEIYSADYNLPPVCGWNSSCRLKFTATVDMQ